MRSWVNGVEADAISALDRGLNYGDGVFETMHLERGAVRHLARHLARLAHSCALIGIALPDPVVLRGEIGQAANTARDGILKLVVTRGAGARGYRPSGDERMTRILTCGPARHADPVWALTGVQVCHCRTPATENAALAGMKHLNRLDCVLARREWTDPQVAEGLMHDSRGSIVGGTMTNLFAVRRGSLLTPAIRACGVRGVMRGVVIDAARGVGISVEEGNVSVDDLAVADELFLSNAVVGLWPIRALAERRYIVGRTTLRLRELCAQVAATEV